MYIVDERLSTHDGFSMNGFAQDKVADQHFLMSNAVSSHMEPPNPDIS